MQRNSGVTLIELLVTLTVAGILAAIAIPSFQSFFISNRLTGYTNDLMASINYARSEAIRRGKPVTICKSSDGATCGGTWSQGWIVFVNLNADTESPDDRDTGEELLRVQGALKSGYTIGANNNFANFVTYGSDGAASQFGTFAICYNNTLVGARSITLTRMRPRVGKDTTGNQIPEKSEGSTVVDISSCTTP